MTDKKSVIPDTYPLGETGPPQTEIDALKDKHGKVKACFAANSVYLIRMMSRDEFVNFQNEINERLMAGDADFDVDLEIANSYTIWPEQIDWTDEPGGAVTIVAQEVSRFSGFVQDRESIEL